MAKDRIKKIRKCYGLDLNCLLKTYTTGLVLSLWHCWEMVETGRGQERGCIIKGVP